MKMNFIFIIRKLSKAGTTMISPGPGMFLDQPGVYPIRVPISVISVTQW
jgi:hypothetical protein